ncbi:hypothetical protein HNP02_001670 [Mycobacterium sp. AZCC_0083]|nr:hypothetical protein [Mycobacterium sp. AZCC_0083]
MMPTWLAGLVAVAAITVTYFFCVRPHLRGRGCTATGGTAHGGQVDRQIAELREELRAMRARDYVDSGRVPSRTPTVPPES